MRASHSRLDCRGDPCCDCAARGESAGAGRCNQLCEQELEDYLSDAAAEETLDAVIDWGRYAEVFAYDDQSEMFSLEDPKG